MGGVAIVTSPILTAMMLVALTAGVGSPPRAARAEGSDDMGPIVHAGPSIAATSCTQGLGICQGLRNDTALRLDIVDDGETFVWTRLGSVTVTSPSGEAVNGADGDNIYALGETINPLAGVIGAYRSVAANRYPCGSVPKASASRAERSWSQAQDKGAYEPCIANHLALSRS